MTLCLLLHHSAGCKIKALRDKTGTYIKTPVRGEDPIFIVTGRPEDVMMAKKEILAAAEHFSQIRASRTRGSAYAHVNAQSATSLLSYGSGGLTNPARPPEDVTISVRVPYRVVGLVVGPKGATIKRIQQVTNTFIVTPSRDREPCFEVKGSPHAVQQAQKEIEDHIAARTRNGEEDDTDGSLTGLRTSPSSGHRHLHSTGGRSRSTSTQARMGSTTGSSGLLSPDFECPFGTSVFAPETPRVAPAKLANAVDATTGDLYSGSNPWSIPQNGWYRPFSRYGVSHRIDEQEDPLRHEPRPQNALFADPMSRTSVTSTSNSRQSYDLRPGSPERFIDGIGRRPFDYKVANVFGAVGTASTTTSPGSATSPNTFGLATSSGSSGSSSISLDGNVVAAPEPPRSTSPRSVSCLVCNEAYDLVTHSKAALVPCGHTLCITCATRVADADVPKCPVRECCAEVKNVLRIREDFGVQEHSPYV